MALAHENEIENAARILPDEMRNSLWFLDAALLSSAEEIRLRIGLEPTVLSQGSEWPFYGGRKVERDDIDVVLQRATMSSLHTAQGELRRGFVTTRGGVRIGVCGTVTHDGGISGVKDVSSVAVRVARQVKGAGASAALEIIKGGHSALILSPPGGGKTTFLRELVRQTSQYGTRVAVADERGEVAAAFDGVPMFDVGRVTDVLTGAPKSEGAMMLLRSMNPQVIALDEITASQDVSAIKEIINCGVRIYATAHAQCLDDLKRRPLYKSLLALGAFDRAVIISAQGQGRRYEVMRI